MQKETKMVILRESILESWLKDIVTFIMFGGLLYFNHTVLSGNGFIDFLFILFVLVWQGTKSSSRVFEGTPKEAIEWLKKQ